MYNFLKFIFGIQLYMFRTGCLSIIRSLVLYTQQCAVYTVLDSYSKIKFEKFVNPFRFIVRIYHDARSSECQIA